MSRDQPESQQTKKNIKAQLICHIILTVMVQPLSMYKTKQSLAKEYICIYVPVRSFIRLNGSFFVEPAKICMCLIRASDS